MTDFSELKLVKTNPREEEVKKKDRYSWRTTTVKQKVHDLELHHAVTGEPVFSVKKKDYGKGYNISWHAHMLAQHPQLEHSFEHGSRHFNGSNRMASDTKDGVEYTGKTIYQEAARAGFKDRFPHSITPVDAEGNPNFHRLHIHDPETGDKIVSRLSGYGSKIEYHSAYLQKHGIDPDVVKGIKAPDAYRFAEKIHSLKGQSFAARGVKSWTGPGGSSDHHSKLYSAIGGKPDHEVSAAHEAHVREQHGKKPNFNLVRHAPNVFHASWGSDEASYDHGHLTSLAHGGKLVSHQVNPHEDSYSGQKLDHRF